MQVQSRRCRSGVSEPHSPARHAVTKFTSLGYVTAETKVGAGTPLAPKMVLEPTRKRCMWPLPNTLSSPRTGAPPGAGRCMGSWFLPFGKVRSLHTTFTWTEKYWLCNILLRLGFASVKTVTVKIGSWNTPNVGLCYLQKMNFAFILLF